MRVLNIGSLNIDHVYQVDHFSRPGESLIARSYQRGAGGKGANQSIAIARAGAGVIHCGKIGPEGTWMLDAMRADGVEVSGVMVSDKAGGHAMIQVDPQGQNSIVVYGGTNQQMTASEVDAALDIIAKDDLVLLQNEINMTAYAMSAAADRGMRVFFNAAPMTDNVKKMPLGCVSVFFVNETEGEELTGQSDPEAIVGTLLDTFPEAQVVLTLGPQGALMGGGGETIRVPAGKSSAVDTTGAGDTFVGYYMAAVCEGKTPREALDLATRAADLCVTRAGAASSIPKRKELA